MRPKGSAIALCLIMLASPLAGCFGEQNNAGPNSVDDVVIICTYCSYNESEAESHKPTLVYFDKDNNVTNVKNKIPEQRLKSV